MAATDPELPDPEDAPRAEDLTPPEPPEGAPVAGDPDQKPAVKAPVPAHGEMASSDQLNEGERAVELAEEDGVDTSEVTIGEAGPSRPRQGGTGPAV